MSIFFRKAQLAAEYLIIMGIVLVVTIPLLYYALSESTVNIQLNQAEDSVNTLARAADSVYSIGPGTKKYVSITMPGGVESYSLANNSVLIKLYIFKGVSDVFAETKADLSGVIPISGGQHRIKVEMLESGYVQFGEANDTIAPEIIWTDPSGTINYYGIILRATTDEYSVCRYDENDIDYSLMSQPFVGSALTHERDLGVLDNGTYVYYARCQDPNGNVMQSSAVINFTIVIHTGGNGTGNETPETNETYEPYPPIISLVSPADNYLDDDGIVVFSYNVTDDSSIWFCQLILNGTVDQSNFYVTREITQNFTKWGIDYGDYVWNINCSDIHGNRNSSLMRNLSTNFTQDTDDPIVRLVAPADSTIRNYWLIKFSYNASDATSAISHCNLHMNGLLDDGGSVEWTILDSPVVEDQLESITLPLFRGNYTWNISCVDSSYYANEGHSTSWHLRINITAGEDAFLDSCAGICGYNGYSDGVCENNPAKCRTLYCTNCYFPDGNVYCTGGSESDTCCCIP